MTGIDSRNTQLISQALYHPEFKFGPGAPALSPKEWTNHLLSLGFHNEFVQLLVTVTNIAMGIVPIDILYEDKITCQNLESISTSWRGICNKTRGIPSCVGIFAKVILTFQKHTRKFWITMWKIDSTLQQDQPLCETLRKVLEEAAWAETRLEMKEKFNFVSWNQVQRSHLLTTDVMPVWDVDQLYRAAETVEPVLNEQDENDDISDFGTPGVANYENQQEQEEGQKVVAVEQKEQGGQLIASENQQEEEEESQVRAGEKVSQPSEEVKLPSAIANEGKTANDSQDDLSQTHKKTKIAAQADDDDKDVVLLTSASAFPFQNAAQSMVLMPVQLPTMSGGFPSGFPFYVLQGNPTAANHNFTPAVASLHHSLVSKSTLKQSPGS